ncbi:MAG: leucine-rich repeat domain-containing protein, partial [Lentimicrobiaceae bacterium]|nr:leucine-rich repeat domain-containing protein [Lentimicrobiaceae bacterium]
MTKRIYILGFAMLLSVASAFAQGGTTGPLTWQLTGTPPNYTLTISGVGEMPDYEYGGAPWWNYQKSITTVVIGNGVTTIGRYAFFSCTALASVVLPNSVTTIGSVAFYGCTALESVVLPNSVTTIENSAFSNCTALESITVESGNPNYSSTDGVLFNKDKTVIVCYPAGKKESSYLIPNGVTTIGDHAFSTCRALESITIPNSVTTIGDHAFSTCRALESITIPNSVTTIGDYAFSDCQALESITIPNSVTTIGDAAFYVCSSLTSITIPNGVTTIGDGAFCACTVLLSIEVETENVNYCSVDGVLFNKEKTILIAFPAGKANGYIIPNDVTTIGNWAFGYCFFHTSITIPNSVTTIGKCAFVYCTALESITNLNPVPVKIESDVFNYVAQSACTLKVPTSAVSAYQKAEVWKEFNIVGGGFLVNPKVDDPEHGYVTGNALYEANATATVTATAHSGYKFVNWTKDGAEISRDNPYSFVVTEDIELVANFEETVGIVAPPSPPEGGDV